MLLSNNSSWLRLGQSRNSGGKDKVDSERRRFFTAKFLVEQDQPVPETGVSILECAVREEDDGGALWIDYAVANSGSERTNVFVYLRKEQPKRSVKVLGLDPGEVFRGTCKESGKKWAEEIFLEVEASSGTKNQREELKIDRSNSITQPTGVKEET